MKTAVQGDKSLLRSLQLTLQMMMTMTLNQKQFSVHKIHPRLGTKPMNMMSRVLKKTFVEMKNLIQAAQKLSGKPETKAAVQIRSVIVRSRIQTRPDSVLKVIKTIKANVINLIAELPKDSYDDEKSEIEVAKKMMRSGTETEIAERLEKAGKKAGTLRGWGRRVRRKLEKSPAE